MKKALAEQKPDANVLIDSCGVSAHDGAPASKGALIAAEKRGASLDDFKSRLLTSHLAEQSDLLIVMEYAHYDYICEMFPQHSDKTRLLGQFLFPDGPLEIPDPVGADETFFESVTEMIARSIQNMLRDWKFISQRFYEFKRLSIAFGADHRGFKPKQQLLDRFKKAGYLTIDCGTKSEESCDHPDFAIHVGELVSLGRADRGVLVCGSGHGMIITANKAPGVRAILPLNPEHAKMSRLHNNANVIVFGADFTETGRIEEMIELWLKTEFLGGKYQRRINIISDYERGVGVD